MAGTLSQQEVKKIIDGRPQGVQPVDIINQLTQKGYSLEGYNPPTAAQGTPQTAQPAQAPQQVSSIPGGPNVAQASQDPAQPQSQPPQAPQQSRSVGGFLGNVLSSLGSTVGGIASAVEHLPTTAKTIADIPIGLAEKSFGEYQQRATGKSQPVGAAEKTVNAIGQMYKDRYGSLNSIEDTLYKDPVGALLDLSAILDVGGTAATKLGDVNQIESLSKAGQVAKTASEAVNPLTAPLKAVTKPLQDLRNSRSATAVTKAIDTENVDLLSTVKDKQQILNTAKDTLTKMQDYGVAKVADWGKTVDSVTGTNGLLPRMIRQVISKSSTPVDFSGILQGAADEAGVGVGKNALKGVAPDQAAFYKNVKDALQNSFGTGKPGETGKVVSGGEFVNRPTTSGLTSEKTAFTNPQSGKTKTVNVRGYTSEPTGYNGPLKNPVVRSGATTTSSSIGTVDPLNAEQQIKFLSDQKASLDRKSAMGTASPAEKRISNQYGVIINKMKDALYTNSGADSLVAAGGHLAGLEQELAKLPEKLQQEVMNAKSIQELKSLQAPFVKASQLDKFIKQAAQIVGKTPAESDVWKNVAAKLAKDATIGATAGIASHNPLIGILAPFIYENPAVKGAIAGTGKAIAGGAANAAGAVGNAGRAIAPVVNSPLAQLLARISGQVNQ